MANRYNDKRGFKKDPDYQYEQVGNGRPRDEGSVSVGISAKSLRGLPQSVYSFKADPYTPTAVSSSPYAILNGFNPTIGGSYKGESNLDGGNVQQYTTSVASGFLKYFDFGKVNLDVNYRYLPISKTAAQVVHGVMVGETLIDEMRQSITEAVSILQSTTFTQMGIYDYVVECNDMPMGSAQTVDMDVNGRTAKVYTDLTDVIYASSIYYQIFWQATLLTLNNINSFYMKQGVMGKSAWNRELPRLRGFFGLMEKSAFKALINSLQLAFPGEFIDTNFAEQINMACLTPSRRSDSITDPMLEVVGNIAHPRNFKLHIVGQDGKYINTIFDSESDLVTEINGVSSSYWDVLEELNDMLSATSTMKWARNTSEGKDIARFNEISWRLQGMQEVITTFKTTWNDVREVYETVSRAGINTWTKGFQPSTTRERDGKMFRNLVVEDIYKLMFSGPDTITFDEATSRWRTYSLWNMYSGIPEYSMKSGGAFLVFSFKTLDENSINQAARISLGYIPVGFTGDYSCTFVARDGLAVSISPQAVVMSEDAVLARLVPLPSQASLTLRVPHMAASADNGTVTTLHKSTMYKTLNTVFGLSAVPLNAGVSDVSLDSDVVAVYQIELEDITNEALSYARTNSPFRGTIRGGDLLGFYGVEGGVKTSSDRGNE